MARQRVQFINLRQAGLALIQAVARLARFHQQAGRRVLILAGDQALARQLDQALWSFDPASFVPHALAGGPDQAEEPVLIAGQPDNLNQAQVLILASPPPGPPPKSYELVIDFAPAGQGPELEAARRRYKDLSGREDIELSHLTALPQGA